MSYWSALLLGAWAIVGVGVLLLVLVKVVERYFDGW